MSTGQRVTMRQLADQIAELTEQVRQLAMREASAEHYFEAGRACGADSTRAAMLGKAASTARMPKPRPHYLRPVSTG